jgi:hypothetical protein
MFQGFFSEHWRDAQGRPAGGVATGRGFTISWQKGAARGAWHKLCLESDSGGA